VEDRERLRHLLEHWAEHNEGHLETYREWAGKAGSLGVEGLEEVLKDIIDGTVKTGELLRKAKGLLD
jgi:hypothetical protein